MACHDNVGGEAQPSKDRWYVQISKHRYVWLPDTDQERRKPADVYSKETTSCEPALDRIKKYIRF